MEHREQAAAAKQRAINLYKEGRTVAVVATLTGHSEKVVTSWLKEAQVMRAVWEQYDAENAGIAKLRSQGMTQEEIGIEFGLSPSTIRKRLEKSGFKRGPSPAERSAAIDEDAIRRLHKEGLGIQQIADELGYGYTTVYRRVGPSKRGKKK